NAIGSVFTCIFGIFWTITAISMGAPFTFWVFGVIFVAMGIVQAVYHFKNSVGKNRFSTFDITDEKEESDPFEEKFSDNDSPLPFEKEDGKGDVFCPYCGTATSGDFIYCPKCGKQLP
ncbi:MAG: zinc ribbon domain-containing protein, partial [Oscillospiraceae bacterium]